jgi:hypothetical protein
MSTWVIGGPKPKVAFHRLRPISDNLNERPERGNKSHSRRED